MLDERELRRLCDNAVAGYTNVVTVLSYTGLRISEALGLVWGDIDFVDGEIQVSNSYLEDGLRAGPPGCD